MTVTIIHRKVEHEQVNPERARDHVFDFGIRPSRGGEYDDLGDGVHEFIDAVERLFLGAHEKDYVPDLEAVRMNIGGEEAWVCVYADGIGDGPDWTANATWYERRLPGLMDALGVYLEVSANVYGTTLGHRVPS